MFPIIQLHFTDVASMSGDCWGQCLIWLELGDLPSHPNNQRGLVQGKCDGNQWPPGLPWLLMGLERLPTGTLVRAWGGKERNLSLHLLPLSLLLAPACVGTYVLWTFGEWCDQTNWRRERKHSNKQKDLSLYLIAGQHTAFSRPPWAENLLTMLQASKKISVQ